MSKTVEIPGGFAELRGSDELRGRDRNLIKAVAMAAAPAISKLPEEVAAGKLEGENDEDAQKRLAPLVAGVNFTWQESMSLLDLRQATAVALLKSWTLDQPLPTMDTIGDLPSDLFDALDSAAGGVTTAMSSGINLDPSPDPDSPTQPSLSSVALSKDDQGSKSTRKSQSDGESTATESSTPD